MKSPANVPSETARDIKEALLPPEKNYGKDNYTVDLGAEATRTQNPAYWEPFSLMGHVHLETGRVMSDHSRWAQVFAT